MTGNPLSYAGPFPSPESSTRQHALSTPSETFETAFSLPIQPDTVVVQSFQTGYWDIRTGIDKLIFDIDIKTWQLDYHKT